MTTAAHNASATAIAPSGAFGLRIDIPALEAGIAAGDIAIVQPDKPAFGDLVAVTLADGRNAAFLFQGDTLRPETRLSSPIRTCEATVHGVCIAVSRAIPHGAKAAA